MGTVHSLARHRALRHSDPGVTKKQLAAELGRSERTIERWQQDPSFPVDRYYDGAMVRYRVGAVRAWLAAGRLPPSQAKGRWDAALDLGRTGAVEAPPAG